MDAAASAVVKQTEREKGATDGNASVIEGAPIPARCSRSDGREPRALTCPLLPL